MINNVVIIGRIANDPELKETTTGKMVTNVTLAVSRSFKNIKGEYETDFVTCTLWSGIAKSTVEHCAKGHLVGVKGRLQTRNYEDKEGKRIYVTEVIAERVTFLNASRNEISYQNELDNEIDDHLTVADK